MEYKWKKVEDELPITYLTGGWDGKNSDCVLVVDNYGEYKIAHYCDGELDGVKFGEWYDQDGYELNNTPVCWTNLPDRP